METYKDSIPKTCIAVYKSRENVVNASMELDRYRRENGVSITIRFLDELDKVHVNRILNSSNKFTTNSHYQTIQSQHILNELSSQPMTNALMMKKQVIGPPIINRSIQKNYSTIRPNEIISNYKLPYNSNALAPQKTIPYAKETHKVINSQPVMFIEYFTPMGTPYYYNTITQTTQWELPPPTAILVKANFEPKKLPTHIQTAKSNKKPVLMPKFTMVIH